MNQTVPPSIDADKLLAVTAAVAREARPNVEVYVALDSSLERDLGLDSLARVELVLRLEREFGTSLPEQALASSETPRDLLRFLLASAGQAPQTADRTVARLSQAEGVRAPDKAQTLIEALRYHVEHQPERLTVFLYEGEKEIRITYQDLWQGALRYAARLAEARLGPGETVAIMLPTCADYLYCFYGVLMAGGIPVPLYPPARLTTIEDHLTRHVGILKSAGASLMVTIPEAKPLAWLLRAQVESLRDVLTPENFAGAASVFSPVQSRGGHIGFLQYTSGSTGNPKGVVLTHANLLANVRAMGKGARATSEDVFVSWLPLYHDMGLIGGCFATMYLGFPVVLMSPLAFLSRPAQWLRAIHRHGGTISGGPNFSYELCMRRIDDKELEGLDLSSWRFAFNGAEPVSPDTLIAFEQKFSRCGFRRRNTLSPVYGLAECSVGLAFTPPGDPWRYDLLDRERFARTGEAIAAAPTDPAPLKVMCCGQVLPAHDLRVVDPAGLELPDRTEGQLQFRGPSATSGYYRNPEATKALFAGDWVNTGDRAYLASGSLYITGREKDIIIRGGRNISPYELEEAIGDVAGIRRGCVAVFGSRDAATGTERVVVLAETRESTADAMEALKKKINALAIGFVGGPVDDIVLAPPHTVPKTSSGKIRRVAAREYYERGPSAVRPQAIWWQLVKLALAGAAPQLRRGWRVARGILYAAWVWLVFALMFGPLLAVAAIAPGRRAWNFAGACSRLFFRLAGIPIVASGLENIPSQGPFVIAANHTSYLDGAVVLATLPWRNYAFVAKRELAANPLSRILVAGVGAQFVERFDVQKSADHAEDLLAAARRGASLIVFPEGTLVRQAGLMPFRAGAFQVAAQAGIPVVPIALRGVRSVLRDGTWYPRRAPVAIAVGAPVKPDGTDWNAAVTLRDYVRAEILRHCGEPDLER